MNLWKKENNNSPILEHESGIPADCVNAGEYRLSHLKNQNVSFQAKGEARILNRYSK